jgi:hypothetical protein
MSRQKMGIDMKGKIIHPRLATGTVALVYLYLLLLLEIVSGIQFISKYIIICTIVFFPIGILVYGRFDLTYDNKRNDDKLFILINLVAFGLFCVIFFLFL